MIIESIELVKYEGETKLSSYSDFILNLKDEEKIKVRIAEMLQSSK